MVSLELWNGAGDQAERAKVRRLVQELPGLTISPDVWEHAADLAQKSRARGLTVPATDLIIASTARVHGVALLHADRHFDLIEETSG
jgi:predicted nucleic acid-binding protein